MVMTWPMQGVHYFSPRPRVAPHIWPGGRGGQNRSRVACLPGTKSIDRKACLCLLRAQERGGYSSSSASLHNGTTANIHRHHGRERGSVADEGKSDGARQHRQQTCNQLFFVFCSCQVLENSAIFFSFRDGLAESKGAKNILPRYSKKHPLPPH